MRRPGALRGFTFIEMMVVIFVLSLITGLVVVNLGSMTASAELSSAGHDLGNKMLLMRDLAVMHARPVTIEIDVDGQRWREVDRPTATEIPDRADREDETFYGAWYELPRSVVLDEVAFGPADKVTRGTVELTFNPQGELFPSGFVVYLRHTELPEDEGISVEVSGLTGVVDYQRGRLRAEEVREEHDF